MGSYQRICLVTYQAAATAHQSWRRAEAVAVRQGTAGKGVAPGEGVTPGTTPAEAVLCVSVRAGAGSNPNPNPNPYPSPNPILTLS